MIRKGRDDGTQPYVGFYAALKEAEAEFLKECLENIKLSMIQGNVDSAKFLLERRFASQGYSKTSQVSMKSQNENLNLNLNAQVTQDETEKIRANILAKLKPKNRMLSLVDVQ